MLQGCATCPKGAVLVNDLKVKKLSKGAVSHYALPARCMRCDADLHCSTCLDGVG